MKISSWKLTLIALACYMAGPGKVTVALAADEESPPAAERLQRLERRVNELAQHQEQIMRRLGELSQRQPGQPPFVPPQEQPGPMPSAGPENVGRPFFQGAPVHPLAAKVLHDISGLIGLLFVVGIICNVLLAVWIFTDIRKRGEGSGIFVALALVAGIPSAIIYALVRLGERKP